MIGKVHLGNVQAAYKTKNVVRLPLLKQDSVSFSGKGKNSTYEDYEPLSKEELRDLQVQHRDEDDDGKLDSHVRSIIADHEDFKDDEDYDKAREKLDCEKCIELETKKKKGTLTTRVYLVTARKALGGLINLGKSKEFLFKIKDGDIYKPKKEDETDKSPKKKEKYDPSTLLNTEVAADALGLL